MEYFNFALGYFALLAGAAFLVTAYAHMHGSLFGVPAGRYVNVALSFGAVHALISVASLLVPPTEPVLMVLLGLGALFLMSSLLFAKKVSVTHRRFLELLGNIFAVSGISFESAHYLSGTSSFSVAAPVAIIVLTSFIIASTAFRLPASPVGARG